MEYEYDVMDGWIEMYSCYTCPKCKYNEGSETGACWVETDERRFEWAYDQDAPRGIKAAIKRARARYTQRATK